MGLILLWVQTVWTAAHPNTTAVVFVPASSHVSNTHTRLGNGLFVLSGTLFGASVHCAGVLRFKYDGVVSPRGRH